MWSNWKFWCRLCAKQQNSSFIKIESIMGLTQNSEKYFMSMLSDLNNGPESICSECFTFLTNLKNFDERCFKVNKMFLDLLQNGTADISDNDAQMLLYRYGIDTDDKVTSLSKSNQTTDTSDLIDNNISAVFEEEEEEEEEEDVPIGKRQKRLRQKRKDTQKTKETPMIKQETKEYHTIEVEIEELDYDNDDYSADPTFDIDIEPTLNEQDEDILDEEKPKSKKRSPNKNRQIKREKQIYTCSICNIEFTREKQFDFHMRNTHTQADLPYGCSKCTKRFTTLAKVQRHENIHLPDSEKLTHPCPYCDKRFSKTVNVQAHVRAIHIGDRPFICEECGKSFVTKGALKEHQITHTDECPFQCPQCPKRFKNMARLRTHEDIHKDTTYVCPHCGLQLNTKRTLKMHMVVHSDQKKYKCHYCGGQFKRSKALKNHLILHTGLRPYTCPFCDKTFANGSNCRSHKKKAHPNELAALEASGQALPAANIPKLEHLQPKIPATGQITIEDAMEAISNDKEINLQLN